MDIQEHRRNPSLPTLTVARVPRGNGPGALLRRVAVIGAVLLASSTAAAGATEIAVDPGDTLSGLAREAGVTVEDLSEANGLSDPDVVLAGSTLRIPHVPGVHLVVQGDTLWSIAAADNTTVGVLKRLNDLSDAKIRVGQRLELPAASIDGAEWGGRDGGPRTDVELPSGTEADPVAATPHVLISPTGVVTPILGGDATGWLVQTPCGSQSTIVDGTAVGAVDVVLDAGHGGWESAAVGPNGLVEKDLNLAVTLRTAELLRARGYTVGLTRSTDIYLPIAARAAIVNAWDPELFVSIHHNGGALAPSSTPGTQVYHQAVDPESKRAAGVLYEELLAAASQFPTAWVGNAYDGVGARLGETGDDFYGVLRMTQGTPAALSEFLWLSNGPEAALLARDDVREAQAEALVAGIVRWFETDDQGSGFIGTHTDTYDSGGGGLSGCTDPELT